LRLIVLTAWNILKREGINQPGEATAEELKEIANLSPWVYKTYQDINEVIL
jgi:hypothetical protein